MNSFGSGLFQPPNTSAIMASVSPERRGGASSMRAFFNSAGGIYRWNNRGFHFVCNDHSACNYRISHAGKGRFTEREQIIGISFEDFVYRLPNDK